MTNDEEGDAALVDSFFLPGGIFDPAKDLNEEEENERQAESDERLPAFAFSPHPLSSDNPWATENGCAIPTSDGKEVSQGKNQPSLYHYKESSPLQEAVPGLRPIFAGKTPLPLAPPTPMTASFKNAPVQSLVLSSTLPLSQELAFRPPPGFENENASEDEKEEAAPDFRERAEAPPAQEEHADHPRETAQDEESIHSHSSVPRELLHEGEEGSCAESSTSSLSASTCGGEGDEEPEEDDDDDDDEDEDAEEEEDDDDEVINQPEVEEEEEVGDKKQEKGEMRVSSLRKNRDERIGRAQVGENETGGKNQQQEQKNHVSKPKNHLKETSTAETEKNESTHDKQNGRTHTKRMRRSRPRADKRVQKHRKAQPTSPEPPKTHFPDVKLIKAELGSVILGQARSIWRVTVELVVTNYQKTAPYIEKCWLIFRQIALVLAKRGALIVSILIHLHQQALTEMAEGDAFFSYMFFFTGPTVINIAVDWFCLPHWTPHVLIYLTLVLISTPLVGENVGFGQSPHTNGDANRQEINGGDSNSLQELSETTMMMGALRIAFTVLFICDGFSSETCYLSALNGSVRMVLAFTFLVLRMRLQISPMIWLSMSLQLFIASMFPSTVFIEHMIAMVGCASIHLKRSFPVSRRKED